MTKDEALKLALEALEAAYARIVTKCEQNLVTYNGVDVDTLTLSQEAITAIKEALAQPEQDGKCKHCTDGCHACDARKLPEQELVQTIPSFAQLQQIIINLEHCLLRDSKQEFLRVWIRDWTEHKLSQNTPPQRTWVELTDEEIDDLSRTMVKGNKSVNWLCQAIEAKLKEKNT